MLVIIIIIIRAYVEFTALIHVKDKEDPLLFLALTTLVSLYIFVSSIYILHCSSTWASDLGIWNLSYDCGPYDCIRSSI